MRKLSDAFEDAQAAVVEWNGLTVHSMFRVPGVDPGSRLQIRFELSNRTRPQGLRIKVLRGALEMAGQQLDDAVLWVDSAPPVVTAIVVTSRESVELRFWNCWRDPAGTTQAWIGNAGMRVEESGERALVLRCSDGFGEATFDDFVASIEIDSPALA